jgi:hypothetical protein
LMLRPSNGSELRQGRSIRPPTLPPFDLNQIIGGETEADEADADPGRINA